MSLIPFHKFLIASAIVFCLGFAAWEFAAYLRDDRLSPLLIAIAFALAALALAFYLRRLRRFLGLPDDRAGPASPSR